MSFNDGHGQHELDAERYKFLGGEDPYERAFLALQDRLRRPCKARKTDK